MHSGAAFSGIRLACATFLIRVGLKRGRLTSKTASTAFRTARYSSRRTFPATCKMEKSFLTYKCYMIVSNQRPSMIDWFRCYGPWDHWWQWFHGIDFNRKKTNMLQPPGHTACTDHFPHLPVTCRCKLSNNFFLIVIIINTTCFNTKFLQ